MIRFLLLGTGSADLYPSPWCACDYCARAREQEPYEFRGFSCALLYPDVLIDCPPDLPHLAFRAGVELYKVNHLLITHSHHDHFSPQVLLLRRSVIWAQKGTIPESLFVPQLTSLTVYGNGPVTDQCRNFLKEEASKWDLKIDVKRLKPFEPVSLDARTVCHPLLAAHRTAFSSEECFLYVLERDGKTILYAADTGWLPEATWEYLRQFSLDLVVVDATYGMAPATDAHLNISEACRLRATFLNNGLMKEDSLFVLTHLSPHWTPPHRLLAPALEKEGVMAGRDGLWLTIGDRPNS
ncbi:MAG: MBL fold metallo-hydrolase [Armatimonadetes bacterium]|nr:MBL fold metallo-hydrolase [Armatimonadota bacterium]MDW8121114.1 MBL fold metallo-hydrolase [Armatimonadota bacterium]